MKKSILNTSLILALFQLTACNSNTTTTTTHYNIEDEPYFKYAWHFDSNSSFSRHYNINQDADIDIKEAWKITKGAGVVVAIIDDAFEANHEDLKENVILTHSIDYGTSDVSKTIKDTPLHGSTVAGFIASPANGKGLVGAAPEAKLILIQQSFDYDSDIIKAFEYAKNTSAKVINCSWGSENVSQSVAAAIKESKDAGITIIFASGNSGKSLDFGINDESELDTVIGVGASDELNNIASYSNYGKYIDVIAPGGDLGYLGLLGIDNSGESGSELQRAIVNNNYAFVNGTSFAAPITAGVVALMISVNPSLTPDQIREILIQSADTNEKIDAFKAVKIARDY